MIITETPSNAVANARKWPAHRIRGVLVDYALNSGICTSSQEEKTGEDYDNVKNALKPAAEGSVLEKGNGAVRLSHAEVGHSPEDEPEE